MSYYGASICPITGYDDFDERDRPEPDEQEEPMENAFLQPVMSFIDAALAGNMINLSALKGVAKMLREIPVQSAYCPVCMDQFDAPNGELAPPTVVKKRSCGHYACDRCARHCTDLECTNDGCADCMSICEGHAEAHCREHVVEKNYCEGCAPAAALKERGRELAMIED